MSKRSFTAHIRTLERRAAFLHDRIAAGPTAFKLDFDKQELRALRFALHWLSVIRDVERAVNCEEENIKTTENKL